MLVIAHRGRHTPSGPRENSLAAFDVARALGVDGIETDIRLSVEDELLLYHDRLAPDGRPVAAHSRASLSQLVGFSVPTLEEALALHDWPLWLLEIKAPEAVPRTMDVVERFQSSRRLAVISFWHTVVTELSKRLTTPLGMLICHRPTAAGIAGMRPSEALGGRVTHLIWCFEFLDAAAVATARSAGLTSFAYALATPDDHRRAKEFGLDAVITDDPVTALAER